MNSDSPGLASDLAVFNKQQLLLRLAGVATIFFLCSLLYCYIHALVVEGRYLSNFVGVIRCVAKDWLVWMLVAPLLTVALMDIDLNTRRGKFQSLFLVMAATCLLGATRIVVEHSWGSAPWSHVLVQYLPRYLFITVLMASVSFLFVKQRPTETPETDSGFQQVPQLETLTVMKGQAVKIIALRDVRYFRSSGNYLDVNTEDCCFLQRNTLKNIERQLSDKGFIRIHRSYLVNEKCVDCVCASKGIVYLHDKTELPLGKTYQSGLPHFSIAMQ